MNALRLACALSLIAATLSAQISTLEWKPAPSRTYDGRPISVESATLSVPEARARPGRTIALGLLRLKSTAAEPGDPVVFLMGGPGIPASVMLRIPPYFDLFDRLRTVGDVILLDQRGTGTSDPVLTCPSPGPLPNDFLAFRERLESALRNVTGQCLRAWREKGVDVAAYNTAESADDLESLRQALGARRLNLLAFSYGTHLALSYARRHPEGVGRIVLEGIRGPDQSLKSPLVYHRGFSRLAEIAASDSVAGQLTPNLEATLTALLDRLDASPMQVAVTGRDGERATLTIGKEGLQLLVSNALDDPRIPAMLGTLERHDSTLLAGVAAQAWLGLGEVNLMARAVDCASSSSDSARARVERETPAALLGNPAPNLVRSAGFCALFGTIALPDAFRSPVRSDAPTLFVSGELDVLGPAEDAAAIATGFPRSVQLVVTNGRHELLPIPGVQDAVVDFLAGREVSGRTITAAPPRWMTVEEAKAPPRR